MKFRGLMGILATAALFVGIGGVVQELIKESIRKKKAEADKAKATPAPTQGPDQANATPAPAAEADPAQLEEPSVKAHRDIIITKARSMVPREALSEAEVPPLPASER